MNFYRFAISTLVMMIVLASSSSAQTNKTGYEVPINDNLTKVCSGNRFGLKMSGEILVPVEYNNINFKNGIAVLSKADGLVYGNVREDGTVFYFQKPKYRIVKNLDYYSDGFLLVKHPQREKHMYIDYAGNPLKAGGTTFNVVFDDWARPFVNGFASGYKANDNACYHIDTDGRYQFKLPGRNVSQYRTSVHMKGDTLECVMFTSGGAYLYQADTTENHNIITLKQLTIDDIHMRETVGAEILFKFHTAGEVLTVDHLGRAVKLEKPNSETIYFIEEARPVEEPEPVVVEEEPEPVIPVFDVETDLSIKAANSQVKATSANKANVKFIFKNMSEDAASGDLEVKITYEGQTRSYTFSLNPLEEESRTIVLDARMPDPSKTVTFRIVVKDKETGATQTAKKSVKILSYRG